jgi:hypothetical protein
MKHQSLDNLQRWMQSVITHPTGVEAGLRAAQSQLEVLPTEVEQIIEPSHRQSSVERLAIYADAYHTRLIECLQAEFPVFRQTVGDDAFAQFAIVYLQRHPSHSYTLGQLGAEFVRFLNETRPAESEINKERNIQAEPKIDWVDFLVDLVHLERTVNEVFDGPGLEQKPRISHENLLSIEPAQWAAARINMAPCLRLLSLRFSLNDYYTQMKANREAAIPPPSQSWLAITRREYIVRRYELSHPQFELLQTLAQGETVGHAIAAAATVYPGEIEQLAADLREWFRIWTSAPFFE